MLQAEVVKGLNAPEIKARLANEGASAVGSTPEAFTDYMKAEAPKWAKVIKASGVRVD